MTQYISARRLYKSQLDIQILIRNHQSIEVQKYHKTFTQTSEISTLSPIIKSTTNFIIEIKCQKMINTRL